MECFSEGESLGLKSDRWEGASEQRIGARKRSKEVRAEFFGTSERQFSILAAHWNFFSHFLKTFYWSRVDLQC